MNGQPTKKDIQQLASKLRDEIQTIIKTIDEESQKIRKARMVSGVIAVIGGGVALLGGVASILTLGLASPLLVAGAAIAAGGTVSFTVSSVIGVIWKKVDVNKIERRWKKFARTLLESPGIYFESEVMARAALIYMNDIVEGNKHDHDKVKHFFGRDPGPRLLAHEVEEYISEGRKSLLKVKAPEEFVDKFLFEVVDVLTKLLKILEEKLESHPSETDDLSPLNKLAEFLDMIASDTVDTI